MTILNEYSDINGAGFVFSIILIAFAVVSIFCFSLSISESSPIVIIIATLIMSVCLSIGASTLTIYTFNNPEHYIECTLDENYPAQELIDKYEIISTKGKIIKLREKENGT